MAASDEVLMQLAQGMGQLNARMREMADAATEQIHGYYREARRLVARFDDRQGFGVRGVVVPLTVTLNTPGVASLSQTFKVADNEDLLIHEVRGVLTFNDWTSEVALAATLSTNVMPRDRMMVKASNCKIQLRNNDSSVPVIDNPSGDISLASIMAELGAPPLRFGGDTRPAFIIPHGQTMKMTATLALSTAALIGGSSDYGVALIGTYMTRPPRK